MLTNPAFAHFRQFLFWFVLLLKNDLFERVTVRRREREISSVDSHPRWPRCPMLGQLRPETSSQELFVDLPHWWQCPSTWAILYCFP